MEKCLHCRGAVNGLAYDQRKVWSWLLVTIKLKSAYHWVHLGSAVRTVNGGGVVYQAATACGIAFEEEVELF